MRLVMAAETAREVCVAQIIRVRAPRNSHLWENVAVVNAEHRLRRTAYFCLSLTVHIRVLLFVKVLKSGGNLIRSLFSRWITCLQQRYALFLGFGKQRGDVASPYPFINGSRWELECVRGPIVAVQAIHHSRSKHV